MKHLPFDFCDWCPEGEDRYPEDDLCKYGDLRLCPTHLHELVTTPWSVAEIPDDDYDRRTKCEDDI